MKQEKMNIQRIKYRDEKDMNSFKERVSVKEDTTIPEKLLSPKGAIDCREHQSSKSSATNADSTDSLIYL
jgi:hypothetical protein